MTPERIGRYEIVGRIGQGAMGEVFRAHDPVLKREVAVKTITAGRGEDETLRKRFQREAQAAAKLSHPNIVKVFELGEHSEQLFMAMELLDGTDLKRAIQAGGLSLARRLEILEKICEGLSFAHAKDIVHRDLKPANIHITRDGSVKIMDFGLARFGGSSMTRTGMVMGTPHYMAPEQVKGGKADARSDVFALGALAYELLTGRKPFDAETMHAVLFKVMQEEPPPARDLLPELPPVVVQVVEKALAKEPQERFADAGRMLSAVRKARQAIASGRGDRLLSELRPGGGRRASRPGRSGAESSASGSQSRSSQSDMSPGRSLLPWAVAAVAIIGLVVVGLFAWRGGMLGAPAAGGAESEAVQSLASAVVETQVELARRRLEAGDFADAADRAERALKLDPGNEDAQDILRRAQEVVERVVKAAADARAAAAAGDATGEAEAVWALMKLDPSHAVVAEMAPDLGESFRPRAEEARRLMAEARGAAQDAGASRLPEFEGGQRLGQDGERAFGAGDYGTAAQHFLEARDRYQHALSR
jgi:tRNA A-37 threonylcarbamoyl transferase component Bud32/tetratricopeptide (TPR) repeat protein